MTQPICSKCGRELLLESIADTSSELNDYSGGPLVMGGDQLLSLMSMSLRHPRACTRCQKDYCTGCAIKAGEKNKTAYHACPDCGAGLGDYNARPVLLASLLVAH